MGCWKEQAKRHFDSWSGTYDRSLLQRWFFGPAHDCLLRESVRLPRNATVLDVGCGTGRFVHRLLNTFSDVKAIGVDLSEPMLEKARARCADLGDRVRFVHGDSEHLPVPASSVELATCTHSIHHYPRLGAVLDEIHRVLKPGGELLVLDADRDGWWGWLIFQGIVRAIEGAVHHCTSAEMRTLSVAAGFGNVTQFHSRGLIPWLLTRATAQKAAQRLAA